MGSKRILLFSLIFGVVTFLITTIYLGNVSSAQKYKDELLPVVVAKVAIQPKTLITKEMVEISKIPRAYVLPGTTNKPEEVIGKIATLPMIPGEQMTSNKINVRNQQMGLAVIVPKNKRAVAVEVDAAASIAGLIKPGDMVDVVCTLEEFNRTVTILQNIPVLAIGQQMEAANNNNGTNNNGQVNNAVIATLALDLQQSEKLVMASNKGRLRLLLRGVDDNGVVYSWGATVYQLLPYTPSSGKTNSDYYTIHMYKGSKLENKSI